MNKYLEHTPPVLSVTRGVLLFRMFLVWGQLRPPTGKKFWSFSAWKTARWENWGWAIYDLAWPKSSNDYSNMICSMVFHRICWRDSILLWFMNKTEVKHHLNPMDTHSTQRTLIGRIFLFHQPILVGDLSSHGNLRGPGPPQCHPHQVFFGIIVVSSTDFLAFFGIGGSAQCIPMI